MAATGSGRSIGNAASSYFSTSKSNSSSSSPLAVPGLASKISSTRASVALYSASVLMIFGFMACRPPSDRLGIDFIVLLVSPHEPDIDGEELVVDPHHQPEFIAANIEHDAAILQDARRPVAGL